MVFGPPPKKSYYKKKTRTVIANARIESKHYIKTMIPGKDHFYEIRKDLLNERDARLVDHDNWCFLQARKEDGEVGILQVNHPQDIQTQHMTSAADLDENGFRKFLRT